MARTKNEAPATEQEAAAPASAVAKVVTNNTFQVVDNTDAKAEPEAPVESESVELLAGFVQVNYR